MSVIVIKLVEKVSVGLEARIIKVVTSGRKLTADALIVLLAVRTEYSSNLVILAMIIVLIILISRVIMLRTYRTPYPFTILIAHPSIPTRALRYTLLLR